MKYTEFETGMAGALLGAVLRRDEEKVQMRARVIWEGEYAGFTFWIIEYGRKDAPKFLEVCFSPDGVERGWVELDDDGSADLKREGFPWYEGFELPTGMTEKGLDAFFQAQPWGDAFRALWEE